jgi:hypothetical protein
MVVEQCSEIDAALRPDIEKVHSQIMPIFDEASGVPYAEGGEIDGSPSLGELFGSARRAGSAPARAVWASGERSKVAAPGPALSSSPAPRFSAGQQAIAPLTPVLEEASGSPGKRLHTGTSSGRASRTEMQLALPDYQPIPSTTQTAMIVEVLMNCNIEIPSRSCCWFHGSLQSLKRQCDELSAKPCGSWNILSIPIRAQCPNCGVLNRDEDSQSASEDCSRACYFCGADIPKLDVDGLAEEDDTSPAVVGLQ